VTSSSKPNAPKRHTATENAVKALAARTVPSVSKQPMTRMRPGSYGGETWLLIDKAAEDFDALVTSLHARPGWKETYALRSVERLVDRMLASALIEQRAAQTGTPVLPKESLSAVVREVLDGQIGVHERLFTVPLSGVRFLVPLENFMGVTFRMVTPEDVATWKLHLEEIVDTLEVDDPAELAEAQDQARTQFHATFDRLLQAPVAECIVRSDAGLGRDLARTRVAGALVVLRAGIPLLSATTWNVAVGVEGEVKREVATMFEMTADRSDMTVHEHSRGPVVHLEIGEWAREELRRWGVLHAAAIATTQDLTKTDNIDVMLLNAVIRLGKAAGHGEDNGTRFLELVSALESLFSPGKGAPVMSTIVESVALLIGADLPGRIQLAGQLKKLYNQRSRVTHGEDAQIELNDVVALQQICYRCVRIVFEQRETLKDRQGLRRRIEELRYSLPAPTPAVVPPPPVAVPEEEQRPEGS